MGKQVKYINLTGDGAYFQHPEASWRLHMPPVTTMHNVLGLEIVC